MSADKDPADVLEQAADILLVNGRCRGKGHDDETGGFCPLGAIAEAIKPGWWQTNAYWYWAPLNRAHPAAMALANRVGLGDIPGWNDRPETSDDDVRDALLLAAKDLRGAS